MVSNEVLFLSVGVVLQLIFYDTDSKGPCGHSLFHDRVAFEWFGFMIDDAVLARKHSHHHDFRENALL